MATHYTAEGKKISSTQYRTYLKQLKEAESSGTSYEGSKFYSGKELKGLHGDYYDDAGKAMNGVETAKYLAQLKTSEAAGMPYAGNRYYTADQLSDKYGGYSADIIAALKNRRQYLTEAPGEYNTRSDEQLKAAAENRFAMTYGMQQTAAANKRDANVMALGQQMPGIEQNYAAQVHASNKQHLGAFDALKGSMASRGLGRSSYAGALAGNQLLARDEAAGGINAQKTNALNDLQAQITGEHTAYNATSEQLAAGKANDTAAYMDQHRQEEFANQQSAAAGRIDYLNAILNLPKNKGKKKKNNGRGGGTSGGALNGAGSGGSA
ncbi:MAG: hypothetical protein RSD95_17240, partial [Clostridia bacterium]